MSSLKRKGMFMTITCPNCGRSLKLPADAAGRTGTCPACKHAITIPAAGAAMPAETRRCRHCRQPLPGDAVICLHCGLNQQTGQFATTAVESDGAPLPQMAVDDPARLSRMMLAKEWIRSHKLWVVLICVVLIVPLLGMIKSRNSRLLEEHNQKCKEYQIAIEQSLERGFNAVDVPGVSIDVVFDEPYMMFMEADRLKFTGTVKIQVISMSTVSQEMLDHPERMDERPGLPTIGSGLNVRNPLDMVKTGRAKGYVDPEAGVIKFRRGELGQMDNLYEYTFEVNRPEANKIIIVFTEARAVSGLLDDVYDD